MTLIKDCIFKGNTTTVPIWLMRQAGRYLPEFRKIRKKNPNFINLCLNEKLASLITLQPLKRFDLDAAIIFSDILMVPHALNQTVNFKKNFGPKLKDLNLASIEHLTDLQFKKKLDPIYQSISQVKKNSLVKDKRDLIGFVGAPWTLLVYMFNKSSPKKKINKNLFKDKVYINKVLKVLNRYLKLHIKEQVRNGASIIQIFDSWSGLVEKRKLEDLVYKPTRKLVKFTKSLGVPVITFPRNIENYKEYCNNVKPDVISIDYNVNPHLIRKKINIPIQGGLNPKILLSDKSTLKKETIKYLEIFKDHPYIFNLGHGVMPQTKTNMVDYLVKLVKDHK